MVPTRGRRKQCERLLESFYETRKTEADIVFLTDPDDQEEYKDFEHGDAFYGILEPRGSLQQKLNRGAEAYSDYYDALFYVADDHVFRTPGWDEMMLAQLNEMGGSGMVYPEAMRRSDVPEIIMISSDIVQELGHFAEPSMEHFALDNAWAELGKRSQLLRYCPAVVEHLHYTRYPEQERDQVYADAEKLYGPHDTEAYPKWQASVMPFQVAVLRRNFNPDVHWVLGKV